MQSLASGCIKSLLIKAKMFRLGLCTFTTLLFDLTENSVQNDSTGIIL